jgi:hypothetical protein
MRKNPMSNSYIGPRPKCVRLGRKLGGLSNDVSAPPGGGRRGGDGPVPAPSPGSRLERTVRGRRSPPAPAGRLERVPREWSWSAATPPRRSQPRPARDTVTRGAGGRPFRKFRWSRTLRRHGGVRDLLSMVSPDRSGCASGSDPAPAPAQDDRPGRGMVPGGRGMDLPSLH